MTTWIPRICPLAMFFLVNRVLSPSDLASHHLSGSVLSNKKVVALVDLFNVIVVSCGVISAIKQMSNGTISCPIYENYIVI